jgi:hypothetical protein
MAKKIPALPDVFASPGAAPTRGTAIEDLPPAPEEPEVEELVAEHEAAEPPRADDASRPATDIPSRGPLVLVVAALAVGLTAPLWEAPVLAALGIRTPVERAAEYAALAVAREEQRIQDFGQHLAATDNRIATMRTELAAASQGGERLALLTRTMAMVRLADTLRRPMPFAAELAVARAGGNDLGPLQPLIDRIGPYADTGVPGIAQLRREFDALRAKTGGHASPTAWLGDLASWTHLRAGPQGDTPLDEAAARVADEDLPGALAQLTSLSDAERAPFASWMQDAQARVAADSLAAKVSDMVGEALKR